MLWESQLSAPLMPVSKARSLVALLIRLRKMPWLVCFKHKVTPKRCLSYSINKLNEQAGCRESSQPGKEASKTAHSLFSGCLMSWVVNICVKAIYEDDMHGVEQCHDRFQGLRACLNFKLHLHISLSRILPSRSNPAKCPELCATPYSK